LLKVNAKYIKEMPQPSRPSANALSIRWDWRHPYLHIKLVHVPAKNFKGTDGLQDDGELRMTVKLEDDEEDDDEDIQDGFQKSAHFLDTLHLFSHTNTFFAPYWVVYVSSFSSRISDNLLDQIFSFPSTLQLPSFLQSRLENVSSNNPELFHQGRQIVETTSFKSRLVILNINRRNKISSTRS